MMAFRDGEKNGELMTGGLVKYKAPLTYLLTHSHKARIECSDLIPQGVHSHFMTDTQ